MGISTHDSRFEEIFNQVSVINEHHLANSLAELIETSDNEVLWCALVEAYSFCEVFEAFKDLKDHEIPRRKFSDMLQGPLLPRHEDPHKDNIRGRNTLFEMQVAAKLMNNGIKILGFDDVDFEFNNVVFNTQCKRIYSDRRIGQNITKAARQFAQKMRQNSDARGIIWLSIDKLTGTEGRILQAETERDIAGSMERLVSGFINDNSGLFDNVINMNVVAICVALEGVAEVLTSGTLTRCFQIAMCNLCDRRIQLRDFHVVNQLGKQIAKNN